MVVVMKFVLGLVVATVVLSLALSFLGDTLGLILGVIRIAFIKAEEVVWRYRQKRLNQPK